MADSADCEWEAKPDPEMLLAGLKKGEQSLQSDRRCQIAYNHFSRWKKKHGLKETSEKVLLDYFKKLTETHAPISLWSTYSMLKRSICQKESADIGTYANLKAVIINANKGYKSKERPCFTTADIYRFLRQAPDGTFLPAKVVAIFAVTGECRIEEFVNVTTRDVIDTPQHISVKLTGSKPELTRSFHIEGEMATTVRKYLEIRGNVADCDTDRFFLRFIQDECSNQVMGKHKLAQIPKSIAEFLGLPEPNLYTSYSLRRYAEHLPPGRKNARRTSQAESLGISKSSFLDDTTNDANWDNIVKFWKGKVNNGESKGDLEENSKRDPEMLLEDFEKSKHSLKSERRYQRAYGYFWDWKREHGYEETSEIVLLEYFKKLFKTCVPDALWSIHSMLKRTILQKEGTDIRTYSKLKAAITCNNKRYRSKRCPYFSNADIHRFLREAPDEKFLLAKVVAIFGLHGVYQVKTLIEMTTADVVDKQRHISVKTRLPICDGSGGQVFHLEGEFAEIVRRYLYMRSCMTGRSLLKRFFVRDTPSGRRAQVIGKHTFLSFPKMIAEFLNLPDSDLYRLLSFIRTKSSESTETAKSNAPEDTCDAYDVETDSEDMNDVGSESRCRVSIEDFWKEVTTEVDKVEKSELDPQKSQSLKNSEKEFRNNEDMEDTCSESNSDDSIDDFWKEATMEIDPVENLELDNKKKAANYQRQSRPQQETGNSQVMEDSEPSCEDTLKEATEKGGRIKSVQLDKDINDTRHSVRLDNCPQPSQPQEIQTVGEINQKSRNSVMYAAGRKRLIQLKKRFLSEEHIQKMSNLRLQKEKLQLEIDLLKNELHI